MPHDKLYLAVLPLFLRVLQANQSLRPAFITAQAYWLADAPRKLTFRPGKQSTYPKLLRAARLTATREERLLLTEIISLSDQFLPLQP